MRISLFIILIAMAIPSLHAQRRQLAGYTPDNYEIECAGVANQGAKMLRIWGYGRKPDLAILQAKRNAVHGMIHKGVVAGQCNIPALIQDASFANRHKSYFEDFFEDGGAYLSYVALSGGAPESMVKVKERGRKVYKASLIVIVQYDALRNRLVEDIDLPTLSSRF